jgi:hypothetical protein
MQLEASRISQIYGPPCSQLGFFGALGGQQDLAREDSNLLHLLARRAADSSPL